MLFLGGGFKHLWFSHLFGEDALVDWYFLRWVEPPARFVSHDFLNGPHDRYQWRYGAPINDRRSVGFPESFQPCEWSYGSLVCSWFLGSFLYSWKLRFPYWKFMLILGISLLWRMKFGLAIYLPLSWDLSIYKSYNISYPIDKAIY